MAVSLEDAMASLPITLKEQQKVILKALINGEHVFGVLPTGYGKSVCFGVFGELMDKVHPGQQHIVIVISPLRSLIIDQVQHWTDFGIKCASVLSDTSKEDKQSVLDCKMNLVFMSPEMALEMTWRCWIINNKEKICLLAVDEVHCITSWGTTFREDYLKISSVRSLISRVPVLLLTATVTPKMVTEILQKLRLQPAKVKMVAILPDRPNIFLDMKKAKTTNITEAADWLVPHLLQGHNAGKVIIYCRTMSDVRTAYGQIMGKLGNNAWSSEDHTVFTRFVDMFHGSISKDCEERILSAFPKQDSHIRCVVATGEFGLRVQVPDVRYVLHWGPAADILSYWQEVGCCARDGGAGKAITLLYTRSVSKAFIDGHFIDMTRQVLEAKGCIRKCVFKYLYLEGMRDYNAACGGEACCSNCNIPIER